MFEDYCKDILKELKLPEISVRNVEERFLRAEQVCRGSFALQPLIQPLPLCNNHLRPDVERADVNVRQFPLNRKKAEKINGGKLTGKSIVEVSALVRTESMTFDEVQRRWSVQAIKSGCFSSVFGADVLRRVNTEDVSSMCYGVPFGVAENIYIKGQKSSWGPLPPIDSDVAASLLRRGAVPVGYIKSAPYGMGGESAAQAVAAGAVPFALGMDIGGSGLVSAAQSGVAAIRTTYGLCSRFGVLGRAPSAELVCVNAGSIRDLAMISRILFEAERNDCTSFAGMMNDWYETLSRIDIKYYTVGLANNLLDMRKNPYVSGAVLKAAKLYELLGAKVHEINVPLDGTEGELLQIIAAGECRIEDMAGCRRGWPDLSSLPERARQEILFKHVLLNEGTVIRKARQKRMILLQNFERAFSKVNAVICPAAWDDGGMTDMQSVLSLAGICALTVPCGKTAQGLNIGMLITARQYAEDVLLVLGRAYEQAYHMEKEMVRRGRHCVVSN